MFIAVWQAYLNLATPAQEPTLDTGNPAAVLVPGPPSTGAGSRDRMVRGLAIVDGRVCSLVGDNLENNEMGSNRITISPGLYAHFAERDLGKPVESKSLPAGRLLTYRCAGVDGRVCRVQVRYDAEDRARACSLEAWTHAPEQCKCRPGRAEL